MAHWGIVGKQKTSQRGTTMMTPSIRSTIAGAVAFGVFATMTVAGAMASGASETTTTTQQDVAAKDGDKKKSVKIIKRIDKSSPMLSQGNGSGNGTGAGAGDANHNTTRSNK
jgi:hypothetical protein